MKTRKLLSTALIATLGVSVLFTGCGKINENATLVTIENGEEKDTISLGYGNFVARYQQALYDQYLLSYYGESMWTSDMSGDGTTFQESVKSDLLDSIEEQYLCKLHASEYGVELSEEETAKIAEAAKSFMEANSAETIEELGATEEYVKTYLEYRTYATKVAKEVKETSGVEVSDEECWQRAFSYVLFASTSQDESGNTVSLTEDEIASLRTDASILAAAEDFDSAAAELGSEVLTATYTKGEESDSKFDMTVISAAEALNKVGQVSDVVEVEGVGLYVLRLDSDHDAEASETQRETLLSSKKDEFYTTTLDGWKEAITWTVDDSAWAKVKFDDLFKAVEKEEAEAETSDEVVEDTAEEDTTEEETEESEETTEEESEETSEEEASETEGN